MHGSDIRIQPPRTRQGVDHKELSRKFATVRLRIFDFESLCPETGWTPSDAEAAHIRAGNIKPMACFVQCSARRGCSPSRRDLTQPGDRDARKNNARTYPGPSVSWYLCT